MNLRSVTSAATATPIQSHSAAPPQSAADLDAAAKAKAEKEKEREKRKEKERQRRKEKEKEREGKKKEDPREEMPIDEALTRSLITQEEWQKFQRLGHYVCKVDPNKPVKSLSWIERRNKLSQSQRSQSNSPLS